MWNIVIVLSIKEEKINSQSAVLRGKVEGEMVRLSEGSSVKESPEDKQAGAPCIRGRAKC